ncbi:lysophospholipid acyltransferase family protein [Fonticella tunisiensis]|uniref:1-acyl-sn-glycerol-3-phosphate acyltransferase n=1 Tax=Fonticella tunisiensis TaxID=1096341 RepID=A0A4R7KSD8_9CLOT|nr:lysophospholipid acyltransferase family protein [Fonticella tunisiensis]TDT61878.1 1-acyl-sn-glycerol-3-phosphate acyltransferase [Fonticella tunisiensis]
MFYNFAKALVSAIFHLIYRIDVVGLENVPEDDGALICPNHFSNLDPFLVAIVLPKQIRFMTKYEAFKNPVLRFLLYKLGMFPVKRGEADLNAVKTTLKILRDKQLVGLFPEGTRIKGGAFGKANPGVAVFSIKSSKPIIPVYISGNFKPFTRMKVIFGEPIDFSQYKGTKLTNEEYTEISQKVMEEIKKLKEGIS